MNGDQSVIATFTANPAQPQSPPPSDGGGPPASTSGTGSQQPSGGGGAPTATGPAPSPTPTCTLTPSSARVSAPARIERTRHGKRKTVSPKRTLTLKARCDQAAQLRLAVTLVSVSGSKQAKHYRAHTFHIAVKSTHARAGVPVTITVKLPAAALGDGARDAVAAILTAANANGSSTATAKISHLILV
jgi:hypothetical protein